MLKNYLKVALRTLRRNKGYTLINVGGLAVGLAASGLIALFVAHELSYDDFHERADRTYRVLLNNDISGETSETLPEMVGPDLQNTFPEVEAFTRLTAPYKTMLVSVGGRSFYEDRFWEAGPGVLDVLSFPAVAGSQKNALARPGTAVLSEQAARRYFGSAAQAVGRSFVQGAPGDSTAQSYTVTAVVVSPSNSHLQFDVLAHRERSSNTDWTRKSAQTYVVLHEGAKPEDFRAGLPDFIDRRSKEAIAGAAGSEVYKLRFQPITEIHLQPEPGAASASGPMQYLYIFSAAALLILLIACVNYVNLATARVAGRAKEAGVRRTVGARREQVAAQFLAEAALTALLAAGLAVALMRLLLPVFNYVAGTQIAFAFAPGGVLLFAAAALVVGLAAGAYPALVLSGFRPVEALRGSRGTGRAGARRLRQGLVVFQFAVSVALIVAAATVWSQMDFVRTERLNTGGEEIVFFQKSAIDVPFEAFKKELLHKPGVARVAAGTLPSGRLSGSATYKDSTGTRIELSYLSVGRDYLSTLGIDLVAGQGFDAMRTVPDDAVIVNRPAIQWRDLTNPVGRTDERLGGKIVGVVEDFHFQPLHQEITPLVMRFAPELSRHVLVRLRKDQTAEGLVSIRAAWEAFVPDQPPRLSFLDDELDEAYRATLRMGRVFGGFAALAVGLAALGLFGLAAFAAERRRKEIAVRKTFGASVRQIVSLLSKDFLKLVGLGFLVAAPVAWFAMQRWLEGFAYRVELGPFVFLTAGALALVVALLATGAQALRAARTNPAQALRDE